MVKKRKSSLGPQVSPQAIMWRPIKYFSPDVGDDEDELDRFKYVGYVESNFPFDLRTYSGHPPKTVTLYFPSDISADKLIQEHIDLAVKALDVPQSAIAWRRGEEMRYGQLKRRSDDRLHEAEASLLIMKILSTLTDHTASTKKIKDLVPNFYELSDADLARSPSRSNERVWRQIIGNVKVHRNTSKSIFARGLVKAVQGGMGLTPKGVNYLKSIGFSAD